MDVFLIDKWGEFENDKKINFLRQIVSLSRKLLPFEHFIQTTSRLTRGKLNHLIYFLRQSVTLIGQLIPLETFPQARCFIRLISSTITQSRFLRREKKIDSSFLIGTSFYGLFKKGVM